MNIKFARNGREIGDHPEECVPALLDAGALRSTDLFWHEGQPNWQPVSKRWKGNVGASLRERAVGGLLVGLGGLLGWLCVWDPIREGAQHAESVSISLKGILVAPVVFGLGVFYLVAPRWTKQTVGTREQRSPGAFLIGIPLLVVGGLLYWFVKQRLRSYGYDF